MFGGRRPISVGACGNSSHITTVRGGTLSKPCPDSAFGSGVWCNEFDTKAWIDSAALLKSHLQMAWDLLVQTEQTRGVSVETTRLGPLFNSITSRYGQLLKADDVETFGLYEENTEGVATIGAWMVDADCLLKDVEAAQRMYKVKPLPAPSPSPGPGPAPTPAPPPQVPSSPKGSNVGTMLLGVALLGGAAYLLTRPTASMVKRPLPRAK